MLGVSQSHGGDCSPLNQSFPQAKKRASHYPPGVSNFKRLAHLKGFKSA